MPVQSVMPIFKGMSPGLDTTNRIPNIQYTANVVDKAASYSCLASDSGTVFTMSSAATFTLPAVATSTGVFYSFVAIADANMTITAPSGTLVADGNATATTAAFSTGSHKIGGCIQVVCTGAKWIIVSTGNLLAVASIS